MIDILSTDTSNDLIKNTNIDKDIQKLNNILSSIIYHISTQSSQQIFKVRSNSFSKSQ